MKIDISLSRWRKVSDNNREYALFELLDDADTILLDVGFSDDGVFQIAFDKGISNTTVIDWEIFLEIIRRGRELAEHDRRAADTCRQT